MHVGEDPVTFQLSGENPAFGESVVLAKREQDILGNAPWYTKGYSVESLLKPEEFYAIVRQVTERVKRLLASRGVPNLEVFELSNYHKFVGGSHELHQSVIEVTREFRMTDFDFDFTSFVERVSRVIDHPLKSRNDVREEYSAFVIVRINRPGSEDYNPPHKDGYLPLWQRTVNLWVPIAGVTPRSSLPVVPGSHLLPEDKIRRTTSGAVLNGKPYRVPAIVEWDGRTKMMRPAMSYGDVLVFSPLLIHGCAKNMETDTTRVALELRLSSALQGNLVA